MLNSVRKRLLLNSLLISLVTIFFVGMVSLLLINRYFAQQEESYLARQAETIVPYLLRAMQTNNFDSMEAIVAVTSFFYDVRIAILDADTLVIIDSGERQRTSGLSSNDELVQVYIDGTGQVRGFAFANRPNDRASDIILDSIYTDLQSAEITPLSDASIRVPLRTAGQTIGYIQLSEGPSAGSDTIRGIVIAIVIASTVALGVAALFGMLAGRQVTGPLRSLGKAAERMGADDLSARVPASDLTEYNQLATQFNQMADRLSGTIDRLETERTVLRRLIADASHELRTPLTALKTFNELALADMPTNSQSQLLIEESRKQIDHLDALTTGLLDLSRLEARLSGTAFVQEDMRATVMAAVRYAQPIVHAKQQTFDVQLPQAAVFYAHDPVVLQQAVGNLLQNASKYTPAGGSIGLLMTQSDARVEIAVRDDGVGISAEILPNIFDRFYRSPTASGDGTGLGLAIAKEIVTIHGGTIGVASQPASGSTFTIILPIGSQLTPYRHENAEFV